jgi:4-hydroxybenzoyl-CoA reductase subunit beta
MLMGGGTDLVPNMKRRQQTPKSIVSLRGIASLATVRRDSSTWSIGAGATLTSLVRNDRLRAECPGLWQAASQIATPQLRNMGTVGGNLCLDTRCTYYDQTEEWRRAIGYCMKKDGATCWVATSSPRCLAVSSTDLAPMLIALDATVRLVSVRGERRIHVNDLYANDGMHYLQRQQDELLADVTIPETAGWRSAYWKLRRRGSFDFPVASVAVAIKLGADGRVEAARLVMGSVASRPLLVTAAFDVLIGQPLADDRLDAAADAAYEVAKPMDNTDYELHWRKRIVRWLVRVALQDVRGDDVREARVKLTRRELL